MVNKSVSDDCLARVCQSGWKFHFIVNRQFQRHHKVNRQPWINLKLNIFVENLLIFNIVKYTTGIAEIHTTRECGSCDALPLQAGQWRTSQISALTETPVPSLKLVNLSVAML